MEERELKRVKRESSGGHLQRIYTSSAPKKYMNIVSIGAVVNAKWRAKDKDYGERL